jgi:hypothetical protein
MSSPIRDRFLSSNRTAFRIPKPDGSSISPVMHLISKLAKEFGENMEEMASGLSEL